MISRVFNWLYVGDMDYTEQQLIDLNIHYVINVCGEKTDLESIFKHLVDGPNPISDYRSVINDIQYCWNTGLRALVHCRAGMSRSPFIIAIWLSQQTGMDIHDAITFVKIKHPITMPAIDMVMAYIVNQEDMEK